MTKKEPSARVRADIEAGKRAAASLLSRFDEPLAGPALRIIATSWALSHFRAGITPTMEATLLAELGLHYVEQPNGALVLKAKV